MKIFNTSVTGKKQLYNFSPKNGLDKVVQMIPINAAHRNFKFKEK